MTRILITIRKQRKFHCLPKYSDNLRARERVFVYTKSKPTFTGKVWLLSSNACCFLIISAIGKLFGVTTANKNLRLSHFYDCCPFFLGGKSESRRIRDFVHEWMETTSSLLLAQVNCSKTRETFHFKQDEIHLM